MKTYKYNFTTLLTVLIIAMIALCAFAAGLNVYYIIRAALSGTMPDTAWNWFTYAVIIIVGIIGVVVFTSMLINSRYEVTQTEIVLRFGLIVTRYTIADIVAIHVFKKSRKLTLYFKEDRYAVVVVKEEWYKDFIETVIKMNPLIAYGEVDDEKDDKNDKE